MVGFLIATGLQVVLSYLGNKHAGIQRMKYSGPLPPRLVFVAPLLLAFYYVHVLRPWVDVVFYAALLDAIPSRPASGRRLLLVGPAATRFQRLRESCCSCSSGLLAGYALAISVPTVIDRSLSFYILEKLHQRGGGIQLARFEEVFTAEYVKEHRLVDVRLTEQLQTGTVLIENGCVKLTPRGERLAGLQPLVPAPPAA